MSQALIGRLAIKARQLRPGEIFATEIQQGQLVEITDLKGHQVAQFAALSHDNPRERLSPAMTRMQNGSIIIREGMKLSSNRGTELFELIEDTVGRHDLLAGWDLPAQAFADRLVAEESAMDPKAESGVSTQENESLLPSDELAVGSAEAGDGPAASTESLESSAADSADLPEPAEADRDQAEVAGTPSTNGVAPESTLSPGEPALISDGSVSAALREWGVTADDLPDPVNWFMNQAILQRGELEMRRPLSERGDRVVLRALADSVIVVRASNGLGLVSDDEPSDVMVRVYR